jgi:hypothetical protein
MYNIFKLLYPILGKDVALYAVKLLLNKLPGCDICPYQYPWEQMWTARVCGECDDRTELFRRIVPYTPIATYRNDTCRYSILDSRLICSCSKRPLQQRDDVVVRCEALLELEQANLRCNWVYEWVDLSKICSQCVLDVVACDHLANLNKTQTLQAASSCTHLVCDGCGRPSMLTPYEKPLNVYDWVEQERQPTRKNHCRNCIEMLEMDDDGFIMTKNRQL